MNWQRLVPTLTSIALILVITYLRNKSRLFAAIIAVMPINIPLALWIVADSAGDDPATLANFSRALFVGLVPVFLWLAIAFLAFRAGWPLWATFGVAYLAWATLLGLGLAAGWLSFK